MSKPGSGGIASASESNVQRRERLRQLAAETADLANDPYLMKNHLGSYECRLCLTLHTNEGSYLAHTQGKRHQQNLARRAAKLAKDSLAAASIPPGEKGSIRRTDGTNSSASSSSSVPRVGRPGYRVVKQRDPVSCCYSLLFSLSFPLVASSAQPRTRFMSTYEQRVEKIDPAYQFFIVSCEPYETIAFKLPNIPINREADKFITHWDESNHQFMVQISFMPTNQQIKQQQENKIRMEKEQQQQQQQLLQEGGEGEKNKMEEEDY